MLEHVQDIRSQLVRRGWDIGSQPTKNRVTLHYNGPAARQQSTSEAWIRHLQGIAQYHHDKVWGYNRQREPLYGDGIMYHFAVDSLGNVYQMRDPDAVLWHCGNTTGNYRSVAIHLPLGGNQDVTDAQWNATVRLCDALIDYYGMPGRECVLGHFEWSKSLCPGPHIIRRLRAYRDEPPTVWYKPPRLYRVTRQTEVQCSNHGGKGIAMVLPLNEVVEIGALVPGLYRAWIANGAGFVRLIDLAPVENMPKRQVAPQSEITPDTPLLGTARISEEAAFNAVCSRSTGEYTRRDFGLYILPTLFQLCRTAGIDPLISLAQICHETDNFSSWWAARPRRNPAGLGVTGEKSAVPFRGDKPAVWDGGMWVAGLSFPTWCQHALPACIGRQVAYAVPEAQRNAAQRALVEIAMGYRSLRRGLHGTAPTIKGLVGTWATDPDYAPKVAKWANWLLEAGS